LSPSATWPSKPRPRCSWTRCGGRLAAGDRPTGSQSPHGKQRGQRHDGPVHDSAPCVHGECSEGFRSQESTARRHQRRLRGRTCGTGETGEAMGSLLAQGLCAASQAPRVAVIAIPSQPPLPVVSLVHLWSPAIPVVLVRSPVGLGHRAPVASRTLRL